MLSDLSDFLYLLSQNFQTLINGLFKTNSNLADGTHRPAHEIRITLSNVFFKFIKNGFIVLVVDDPDQDLSTLSVCITFFRS